MEAQKPGGSLPAYNAKINLLKQIDDAATTNDEMKDDGATDVYSVSDKVSGVNYNDDDELLTMVNDDDDNNNNKNSNTDDYNNNYNTKDNTATNTDDNTTMDDETTDDNANDDDTEEEMDDDLGEEEDGDELYSLSLRTQQSLSVFTIQNPKKK